MRKADLFAKVCIGECDELPHGACKKCIVEALESYTAEAIVEDRAKRTAEKMINKMEYERGRKEALEEAAKKVLFNEDFHCNCYEKIRALAERKDNAIHE